jgi:hypothetical protein
LAGAALALTLGALEAGVRALAPEPLTRARDARRGAFTQPGRHPVQTAEYQVTVQVNAQGFVDRDWGPKAPGVPRVALLGDSFVQAAQVELDQGVGRRLDRWLDAKRGHDVEVLSLGVPGAGTATALQLYDQHAVDLEPDLVVLAFLVSNDVFNNHPGLDTKPDKPYFGLVDGALAPIEAADAGLGAVARTGLWRHSHLVRAVGRRVLAGAEARDRVRRGDGLPVDLRVHDPQQPSPWPEAWAVTEALVAALAERCAADGVAFGVLLLPDRIMATEAGARAAVGRWPALASWDLQAATRQAEARFSPHAPVFDLTPAFTWSEQLGDGALYFARDGHWTARGHDVAAQFAAGEVAAWLPPAAPDGP